MLILKHKRDNDALLKFYLKDFKKWKWSDLNNIYLFWLEYLYLSQYEYIYIYIYAKYIKYIFSANYKGYVPIYV